MYCKNCGKQINDDAIFCEYCGEKIEKENTETVEATIEENQQAKPQAKCWAIFAKVSKICGIVAISTCWIPFMIGLSAAQPGIVFAILGKRANGNESKEQCKLGLVLSIVGASISLVVYVIFLILMGDATVTWLYSK